MTPGQAAFEKWLSLLSLSLPVHWSNFSEEYKQKWEEIAKAAIKAN